MAGAERRTRAPGALARLVAHPSFRWGLLLFGAVALCGLLAAWLAPFDPIRNNFRTRFRAPDEMFWFGTDRFGRDILSRTLFGIQVSLRIGLGVALLTALIGGAIGAVAGFWRKADGPIMRFMDALMAFPAVAMESADFEAWLDERGRVSAGLNANGEGRALFEREGCGDCHRVDGTAAQGDSGPDLSHVGSRLTIGAGLLDNDVETLARFIVHAASLKRGAQMPAYSHLSKGEIEQIATWLKGLQ